MIRWCCFFRSCEKFSRTQGELKSADFGQWNCDTTRSMWWTKHKLCVVCWEKKKNSQGWTWNSCSNDAMKMMRFIQWICRMMNERRTRHNKCITSESETHEKHLNVLKEIVTITWKLLKRESCVEIMLPYSAVAAIDYAAYQSRPGLSTTINNAGSFTHSWLVPTQDLCGVNFKANQQHQQLVVDPGYEWIVLSPSPCKRVYKIVVRVLWKYVAADLKCSWMNSKL